jgi:ATP-dependent RNA helicase RhlE
MIKTRKKNTMNFNDFNFHATIRANIQALNYTEPTPIQAQTIAPILSGSDVMGLAQTGTGKTAAFVLPILQQLIQGPRRKVRALIIAPTRELTEQTHKVIGQLGRGTGVRSLSIYGGVNIQPQIAAIKRGVEIICACPGRLLDHIQRGTINVSSIDMLVLDEADHMFDMGFLPDIKKIIRAVPEKRQTLLFSATMPEDIRRLTATVLKDPVRVQINHEAPVASVSHVFYPVQTARKTDLLKTLLAAGPSGPVLVFARTKMRAKNVARQLESAGYQATALHGNLSQNNRQKALDGFGRGTYKILVATDVAARGIDVRNISHVINYDIPDTVDAYTHRTGRTGRASASGEAFTFVTGSDRGTAGSIKRMLGERLRHGRIEGFAVDTSEAPERPRRQTCKPRRPSAHAKPVGKHSGRPGDRSRFSGRRSPQHAA